MAMAFSKRQSVCSEDDYINGLCDQSFWDTNTGLAVRYAVVVAFFVFVVLLVLGSYLHARRRLRKGLPPLGYHRWLISRRNQPQYHHENPSGNYMGTTYGGRPQAYGMQPWQPPPPAYGQWDTPPQYNPPEGGSKTLANQNLNRDDGRTGVGEGSARPGEVNYPAPAHPPPSAQVTQ